MMAYGRELLGLGICGVVGFEDGFGRPHAYISIYVMCVLAVCWGAAHRVG